MRRFWKIAGIATLVVVLGVATVAAVVAQEPLGGRSNWAHDLRERMHEAIANVLGISVDDYDAALETAHGQVLEQAVDDGLLTQEQADRIQEQEGRGFGRGMMGKRAFGHRASWGGPESSLVAVAADELGMTVDELLAELGDDKSIADVANGLGVDPQTIAAAFLAQRAQDLAQAVADGRITQEQADQMLSCMEERVQECLDEPFSFDRCRPGGFRRGGAMPGRLRSFPGQSES